MKKEKKDVLASTFEMFKVSELAPKTQYKTLGGDPEPTVHSYETNQACTIGDEGCCDTDSETSTDYASYGLETSRGTVTTVKRPMGQ